MSLGLLVGLSAVSFVVVRSKALRDFSARGRLAATSVGFLVLTFGSLTVAIALSALRGTWPLLIGPVGLVMGGLLIAAGLLMYFAARLQMKSLRATWGLTLDQLLTSGPYAFSRNPQLLGAIILLAGVALTGKSLASLLLVVLYAVIADLWILVEEKALKVQFGDRYREYRRHVPRFI